MSSRKYNNVIVFGPTGGVGSQVALEANRRGAKVWLAMRDPTKTIQDIPADVEKSGNFARIQADLTDPVSIAKAIKESGAKAAYIYLIHGASDGMRGALQALRDAGVESVVFLSSFSITPAHELRKIPQSAFIPWLHAQVEIAAEEVGIPYFTALRPAAFASNHFKNFLDRSAKPPRATHIRDDAWVDNITPEDMGAVGAAVLVERPSNGTEIIYLAGPELITKAQSWEIIKKITGRHDINANPITKEEFLKQAQAHHLPTKVAEYLVTVDDESTERSYLFSEALHRESVANIKKYSGKEPLGFAEYIEAHKAEWQAL
ncbi:NAD(P)-binding protein [Cryphonectria parasitica EP155]|uniref:NAD(P)-binding protein n=1 Tax=Cryphonectria parasitica (strain ATCC 38755 / EP155) TaxID=660469 RepID=A0A9P4XW85_CRYP1|nr:NAD(P)-binding protein [Cryphonectria parasitica EP155]KAF3761967.1 NAD(P)-binding protein [Cryphonectria parasitica EP155]